MSRLSIQNIAAPNLVGTSQILANASNSLNQGLGAAAGILDDFEAGQQQQADASVLSTISGINSEQELGNFLNSGQLDGLNLSPALQQTVLGLRESILSNNQARAATDQTRAGIQQTLANTDLTRANINQTNARTSIANAAENRAQFTFQDNVNTQNARRDLTSSVLAAQSEGLQNGRPQDVSTQLAQLTARNETGQTDLVQGSAQIAADTSGSSSYGFLGVNSASGSASTFARENPSLGLTARPGTPEFDRQWQAALAANPEGLVQAQLDYQERHIHAPARQNLQNAGLGRFANDPRVLSFVGDTVVQFGAAGAQASVEAARNANSVEEFIRISSDFQVNNVDNRFRTYLSENPNNRQGLVNRLERRRDQALNLTGGGAAFNDLNQSLAQSGLDPATALQLSGQARAAQNQGQQRIDGIANAAQQENVASAILGAATDSSITSQAQVVNPLAQDQSLGNATQRLAAVQQAQQLTGEGGALQPILRPQVGRDEVTANSVEAFLSAEQNAITSSTQARLLGQVSRFQEDPAGELFNQFNLGEEGVFSSLSREELNTEINSLADELQVTPAIVAVALAENRDVDLLPGNDVNDNFDIGAVRSFIETNLSQRALGDFNERRIASESRQRQVSGLQLQLSNLRAQAQKQGANVTPQLSNQINQVRNQILQATGTPNADGSLATGTPVVTESPAGAARADTALSNAATPGTASQPAAPLTASPNPPGAVAQTAASQLTAAAQDTALDAQTAEFNRVQLRDYVQNSGFQDQLRLTRPGSPERQQVVGVLIDSIRRDTSLSPTQQQTLIQTITGG